MDPGHFSLPGNNLADTLAKIGASLDPSTISLSFSPLTFPQRLSLYTSWRRRIQSGLFQDQIPPVSSEKLTLPSYARCALSRLRCNGHSTLLRTYLHRIGRTETFSCSNCGFESQDIFHFVVDCPVLEPTCLAIFGTPSLFWTDGPLRGELFDYWDSAELIRAPILRNGTGKPTPSPSSPPG